MTEPAETAPAAEPPEDAPDGAEAAVLCSGVLAMTPVFMVMVLTAAASGS